MLEMPKLTDHGLSGAARQTEVLAGCERVQGKTSYRFSRVLNKPSEVTLVAFSREMASRTLHPHGRGATSLGC